MVPTEGIFETLRVYSGVAFKLQEHLARMRRSAEKFDLRFPSDTADIVRQAVNQARQSGLSDALLRITLSGNRQDSELITHIEPLPRIEAKWYSNGIRVLTAVNRRNEFALDAGIKTIALLASIIDFRADTRTDCEDMIFLDTQGHLCEGSASNVFLLSENELLTPPLGCGALPGITRQAVFTMAELRQIPVSDSKQIDPALIFSAAEMFFTSSVREIVPVISVDGRTIGSGRPGAVTMSLMQDYRGITRCNS